MNHDEVNVCQYVFNFTSTGLNKALLEVAS